MDNPIISAIMSRSSYRGKYLSDRVPTEDLRMIMEAGLSAPSGCNKQTTKLIAVDDPELLKSIMAVIEPPICKTAPAVICVLTEKIYAYRDRSYYIQDYSAAIENMLLAIKALGYDSCWFEGHITDEDDIAGKICKILSVPENLHMVCVLPVGKAAEESKKVSKMPFESRACFNSYKIKE